MAPSRSAPISLRRRRAITAGLLLGVTLGALEATVVGTAMPTVVATLGGLAHYSWVFSAYLLTSTASVPIWGRLSDLYGRRRLYLGGIFMFVAGSVLCGAATTMTQLIVFRAVQGLGAGAVIPLSITIVGELYAIEERTRTQALFSGVWGVASIIGPLVGGYITDALSWQWIFFLNLPFGLLSMTVIALAYPPSAHPEGVRVDWPGAVLLFTGITALLVALGDAVDTAAPWFVAAAALLTSFVLVERRATHPILPLGLFRYPIVWRSLIVVFITGTAMFGALVFVPLFVQGVMGGTATEAGQALTPLFLGWVATSILGARLTVRIGYRPVARAGGLLLAAGFVGLAMLGPDTTMTALFGTAFVLGCGMGTSVLPLLLAIQHGVERSQLGLATSLNQFIRSVGAAVGVALMGAILTRSLAGLDLGGSLSGVPAGAIHFEGAARVQFAGALTRVFATGAVISAIGFAAAFGLPHVDFSQGVPAGSGERMLAAEMATLEPESEPAAVGATGSTARSGSVEES